MIKLESFCGVGIVLLAFQAMACNGMNFTVSAAFKNNSHVYYAKKLKEAIAAHDIEEFQRNLGQNYLEAQDFEDRAHLVIDEDSEATALHWCVLHGFCEGIKILCESNNSRILEMANKQESTPLMTALKWKKPDCVELLLNYRCNPVPVYKQKDIEAAVLEITSIAGTYCPQALPMLAAARAMYIAALPEDALLKIWTYWVAERTQHVIPFSVPSQTKEIIHTLCEDLCYVSKAWNRLWDKKKMDLIDEAMLKQQEKYK